jgi:hypothetical protein
MLVFSGWVQGTFLETHSQFKKECPFCVLCWFSTHFRECSFMTEICGNPSKKASIIGLQKLQVLPKIILSFPILALKNGKLV